MKISAAWLRQLANLPNISDHELIDRLIMAGLEVSSALPAAPLFSGVIVAQVTSIQPHPTATNVRLCSVYDGANEQQVVCGAPDIFVDRAVAFAPLGAVLPNGRLIAARAIQGSPSHGMLVSEAELGLSEATVPPSLMWLDAQAPLGADLREYLALDDTILEIELTPNRGDCLSAWGLARECAALFGMTWQPPSIKTNTQPTSTARTVQLPAANACPRYMAAVLKNIDNTRTSPDWLREKLRRAGLRSHSPIVDVTNYVLLEMGQPLHAFDDDQLHGNIHVCFAQAQESLNLLNQQLVTLTSNTLIIADQTGPVAIAGVMGGAATSVTESTHTIFLESAYFAPEAIAGTARRYGLITDAATRFERGVDPQLPLFALHRASELLSEICGASEPSFVITEEPTMLPKRLSLDLRQTRLAQVLGVTIPPQTVQTILQNLQLQPVPTTTGWQVTVPTFRHDITLEVDLIEEVARVYGFNHIPALHPLVTLQPTVPDANAAFITQLRYILQARGYDESIHYSFVSPTQQAHLTPEIQPLTLANPLSAELSQMRTTLWASLLQALSYNTARQITRVRMYEIGKRFADTSAGMSQIETLAGLAYGSIHPLQWSEAVTQANFFTVKNDLAAILPTASPLRFQPQIHPALHPTQSAAIYLNELQIGWLGVLHPKLAQAAEWQFPVVLFEIDLLALQPTQPQAKELSKLPRVQRDLAFLLPKDQLAAEVLNTLKVAGGPWLESCELFDVYQGEHVPADQRSLAFRLQFVATDRTLQESDLAPLVEHLVAKIQSHHFGRLRDF